MVNSSLLRKDADATEDVMAAATDIIMKTERAAATEKAEDIAMNMERAAATKKVKAAATGIRKNRR